MFDNYRAEEEQERQEKHLFSLEAENATLRKRVEELEGSITQAIPAFKKLIAWVDWDKYNDEPSTECWCTDTGTEYGILRCEQCKAREALSNLESAISSQSPSTEQGGQG